VQKNVLGLTTLEPGGVIALHRLGPQVVELRAGDAVFIPAGVRIATRTPGPDRAEFLAWCPHTATYETQ